MADEPLPPLPPLPPVYLTTTEGLAKLNHARLHYQRLVAICLDLDVSLEPSTLPRPSITYIDNDVQFARAKALVAGKKLSPAIRAKLTAAEIDSIYGDVT